MVKIKCDTAFDVVNARWAHRRSLIIYAISITKTRIGEQTLIPEHVNCVRESRVTMFLKSKFTAQSIS